MLTIGADFQELTQKRVVCHCRIQFKDQVVGVLWSAFVLLGSFDALTLLICRAAIFWKPGNVKEFDIYQRNVRELTRYLGKIGKISGKTCQFWAASVFSMLLWLYIAMSKVFSVKLFSINLQ